MKVLKGLEMSFLTKHTRKGKLVIVCLLEGTAAHCIIPWAARYETGLYREASYKSECAK